MRRARQKQVCMPARDDQRQRLGIFFGSWRSLPFMQQNGVDVPLQVVDGDQRQPLRKGQRLGVGDAHQQRSGQPRPAGHGDGVQVGEGDAGLRQRRADHGNDGAQMLAAGQLRNHSAVAGVGGDLRGDHRGKRTRAALDNRGGGLVARGFNPEDQAALVHTYSLAGGLWCAFNLPEIQRLKLTPSTAARRAALRCNSGSVRTRILPLKGRSGCWPGLGAKLQIAVDALAEGARQLRGRSSLEMNHIPKPCHRAGKCLILRIEVDGSGGITLVFHHGFTPALVRNWRTASTAPFLVSGRGCGR